MLSYYYIQNVKGGIQIRAYTIKKESVTYFSQFVSAKVKKLLRKPPTQFPKKSRKLRLKQNGCFHMAKNVYVRMKELEFRYRGANCHARFFGIT